MIMVKKHKLLYIVIFALLLSSCCLEKNDNDYFSREYNVNINGYSTIKVKYSDFKNMISETNFDGTVLFIKNQCPACHDLLEMMSAETTIKKSDAFTIYIVESNEMSEKEKVDFVEEFYISSVPTLMFFHEGNYYMSETGLPEENRLSEIVDILREK